MKIINRIIVIILVLSLSDCAKKGRPTGGEKDETAPLLVSAKPPYGSTNFNKKKIKIYFDEYIILRDLQKQLIVSPPFKILPAISPQGTPSKYISIEFEEDLQPNTTYTFNFGDAVQDNNEGNKLESFKYVFSTGKTIDSLELKGQVVDFVKGKLRSNCSVLLYKLDSLYNDSIVFKQKPNYVTKTTDSLNFKFSNIKEGKYMVVALQEQINDYIFSSASDEIGFLKDTISLPKDSVLTKSIAIFKEEQPFKFKRAKEVSKGKIQFGFTGKQTDFAVNVLSEVPANFKAFSKFEKDKDTLNYFFTPVEKDSLQFIVKNEQFIDTVTVNFRKKNIDTLKITSNISGVLNINDTLFLNSNNPIIDIDKTKFSLKNDSLNVDYKVFKKNDTEIAILFEQKPKQNYSFDLLPKGFTDLYNTTNDTLKYTFRTKEAQEYGSISFDLDNKTKSHLIIELLENDKVIKKLFISETIKKVEFNFLEPKTYKIRAIIDKNDNKIWDTGNYLTKTQPEKIVFFDKEIQLRANWTVQEKWTIDN